MKTNRFKREILIQPSKAGAFPVRRGEVIRIVNVEGGQIGDFICFNLFNFREKLSTGETVNFNTVAGGNGSIYLTVGKRIYSNAQNPMFEITEDMADGVHDLLYAPCSSALYAIYSGNATHANCRNSLTEAVASYGLSYLDIPDPINLFQSTRPKADGTIYYGTPKIKAGEYIEMKALADSLAAVSACPFDGKMDGELPNSCTSLKIQYVE